MVDDRCQNIPQYIATKNNKGECIWTITLSQIPLEVNHKMSKHIYLFQQLQEKTGNNPLNFAQNYKKL